MNSTDQKHDLAEAMRTSSAVALTAMRLMAAFELLSNLAKVTLHGAYDEKSNRLTLGEEAILLNPNDVAILAEGKYPRLLICKRYGYMLITRRESFFNTDVLAQVFEKGSSEPMIGGDTIVKNDQVFAMLVGDFFSNKLKYRPKKPVVRLEPKDCGQVLWFSCNGIYHQSNVIGVRDNEKLVIVKRTAMTPTTVLALREGAVCEAFYMEMHHSPSNHAFKGISQLSAKMVEQFVTNATESKNHISWVFAPDLMDYINQEL